MGIALFQVRILQVKLQVSLARWASVNPAALFHKAANKAGNTDYWYRTHSPSEINNYKQITNLLGADSAQRETQYIGMMPHGRCNQK
jgi:hypothetical protein